MFEKLLRDERTNAALGWLAAGTMIVAAAVALYRGAWLWTLFALVFALVAALPALRMGDPEAMVPWPLLAVGAIAVAARALEVAPDTASYLSIATLAIVFVIQLVAFTPVDFSHRFAVAFAVMTTLAIEAVWIVIQYYADVWLETDFIRSQSSLQQDILLVSVVGVVAGIAFEWFFVRFEPAGTLHRTTREATAR